MPETYVPAKSSYSQYTRPKPDELEPARKDKDISGLLWGLLAHGMPHGNEDLLHQFLPKKGRNIDGKGNVTYFIGDVKEHGTMFSCHMDTVHRKPTAVRPLVSEDGFIYGSTGTEKQKIPAILGADDKVGMYVMLSMMSRRIPGVYVFHVGEERGGIGSSYLVKQAPKWLMDIKRCIAFDRKDYKSVITEQFDVCCSDTFGNALAAELNKHIPPTMHFKLDNTGTFTDSANYTNCVAECTNLSVGYFNQHSEREHFDPEWLELLFLPAVYKVEWDKLPMKRKPGDTAKGGKMSQCPKDARTKSSWGGYSNYGNGGYNYNSHGSNAGNYSNNSIPSEAYMWNRENAKWETVTMYTDWRDIPRWKPLDGIPAGATYAGVKAAICKYIGLNGIMTSAENFASMLYNIKNTQKALKDVEEKLEKKEEEVNKLTAENILLKTQLENTRAQIDCYQRISKIKIFPKCKTVN